MRVFGPTDVPVLLRDEVRGGVRPFLTLGEGAVATSHFGPGARSALYGRDRGFDDTMVSATDHVTVAAPCALAADALTKVVAASGNPNHPLLGSWQARAWTHH